MNRYLFLIALGSMALAIQGSAPQDHANLPFQGTRVQLPPSPKNSVTPRPRAHTTSALRTITTLFTPATHPRIPKELSKAPKYQLIYVNWYLDPTELRRHTC